jgi:uncharacterized membrane protein
MRNRTALESSPKPCGLEEAGIFAAGAFKGPFKGAFKGALAGALKGALTGAAFAWLLSLTGKPGRCAISPPKL